MVSASSGHPGSQEQSIKENLVLTGHHAVAIGSWVADNNHDRFGRDRKQSVQTWKPAADVRACAADV
jgi:hypothetical protein